MTRSGGVKRCVVAFAARERQYLWTIELATEATIAEALEAAHRLAAASDAALAEAIAWADAPVGIFGEPASRAQVPRDGDRIEIYRPLLHDPKESRRERVRRQRSPRRPGRV